METFTDAVMRDLLRASLKTAQLGAAGWSNVDEGPGSTEAEFVDWLTIADNPKSVVADVTRIRRHPLVPGGIPIYRHS